MVRSVLQTIAVAEEFYFSDSKTALCWIKNKDKLFKPFVENRAIEIRKKASEHCWGLVTRDENLADLISWGCSPSELKTCEIWLNGPAWLTIPLSQRPNSSVETALKKEGIQEKKVTERVNADQATVLTIITENLGSCTQATKFSSAR